MGFNQAVMLIFAALCAVSGGFVLIDSYGGWPIFWYDLKKLFRRKK